MKSIHSILFIAFLSLITFSATAQKKVVEDTIFVDGVCKMCKERIEEAAYGKGVKFVEWHKTDKKLRIAYRSDKTTLEEIEKRVAATGHNTENIKAKKEDYEELPMCCQYEEQHTH